jgi:hypothetical protein
MSANQAPSYKVDVFAEAPTEEDPSIDFINTTAAASTGSVLPDTSMAKLLGSTHRRR